MQDREKVFIDALKHSKCTFGIGDDGVVLGDFIIASDMFFEDIHFRRKWESLEGIVEKCFCVNLSDIYAMNGIPKYAILNIALPKDLKSPKNLAKIIAKVADKYGIKIIGGDTCIGDKLHLSLTLLGKRQKKILYRSGVKKGDYLCYLSPFGALNSPLQSFGNVKKSLKNALCYDVLQKKSRFANPKLHPQMLFALNKIAKAGMDISDGIYIDISRLARINKIDFVFLKKKDAWFYSPEEYQMLYALDKKSLQKAKNLARRFRHKLIIFAKVKQGIYRLKQKNHHS